MEFTDDVSRLIEEIAITYLNAPYTKSFSCVTFVREVYRRAGLTVPPSSLNITLEQLKDPPIGYVIFLRHRSVGEGEMRVTHVGIIISGKRVIHCSFFFGKKVVITNVDALLEVYDLATI